MPRVRTKGGIVSVPKDTAATAITAPSSFHENDDIFVQIGKASHPAKFIKYVHSDDNARHSTFAIVRYNTCSTVAQVQVCQLQLMGNTSRLRSSTKSNHSTNTDPQSNLHALPTSIAKKATKQYHHLLPSSSKHPRHH